jgi:hypothetical protein
MAKDPAFLFYSGDFLVGTALFTEAETGQYIKLLCYMHQGGHISKEDMFNICPNISFKVLAKFKTDKDGLFYNERLDIEVEKRKKYSESRRSNRLKSNISKTHVPSYDVAMSTHMENGNENTIEIKNDQWSAEGKQDDAKFKDYEQWTNDAVSGNDHLFTNMLKNERLKPGEQLQGLARSHLALLAKYPKMKPPDQHRFRISLIDHIAKEFKNGNSNNSRNPNNPGSSSKRFSGEYEEHL